MTTPHKNWVRSWESAPRQSQFQRDNSEKSKENILNHMK